ncbi:MAG TPA: GDYXXLXY domain-containing protein [Acidobacteriota bacterium]|nr:GDYXXLXY domain-containing protein [Acidobacteriota bacterium]
MAQETHGPSRKRVMLGALFLVIFLGFMVLYLAMPYLVGSTVVLKTAPVDPFDPIRGQYMVIRYDISTQPINDVQVGDTVYVLLTKGEDVWDSTYATKTMPSSGMYIKGEVQSVSGSSAQLRFGVEQYFFERNAQILDRIDRVELKVDATGTARISRLLTVTGSEVRIKYAD